MQKAPTWNRIVLKKALIFLALVPIFSFSQNIWESDSAYQINDTTIFKYGLKLVKTDSLDLSVFLMKESNKSLLANAHQKHKSIHYWKRSGLLLGTGAFLIAMGTFEGIENCRDNYQPYCDKNGSNMMVGTVLFSGGTAMMVYGIYSYFRSNPEERKFKKEFKEWNKYMEAIEKNRSKELN